MIKYWLELYGIIDRVNVVMSCINVQDSLNQKIMKAYLSIGLLTLSSSLCAAAILFSPMAQAQCVMNDTNLQVSISGSKQPTNRTNNVRQGSTGNCVGNTVNTTNVQTNVGGTDRATQNRQSNQQLNGGNSNPTGVNLAPAKFRQNVQIDVYNPADRLRH